LKDKKDKTIITILYENNIHIRLQRW
jgi:hypothetical protein